MGRGQDIRILGHSGERSGHQGIRGSAHQEIRTQLLKFGEMVASQMMKGNVKIQYGCTIDIFEILSMLVLLDLELI